MKLFIELNHDEIQKKLPYMIIAETWARSVWDTGRFKRLMNESFSKDEIRDIEKIRRLSYSWAFTRGVPDSIKLDILTFDLWKRLADFCGKL